MKAKLPRRDRLFLLGTRALRMTNTQMSIAWEHFGGQLIAARERDMPKFEDVYRMVRRATIYAKRK